MRNMCGKVSVKLKRDYESYIVDPGTPDSTEQRTEGPLAW